MSGITSLVCTQLSFVHHVLIICDSRCVESCALASVLRSPFHRGMLNVAVCSTTYKLQGERGKKPPNYEAIWSEMAGAEISTFVLTAAVPDDPSVDMMAVDGLVEGHAYGILDVRDVVS